MKHLLEGAAARFFSRHGEMHFKPGTTLAGADGRKYGIGVAGTYLRLDPEGIRKRAERQEGLTARQRRKRRKEQRRWSASSS